ncbi:hypothetical protein [Azospirillum sp. A29]|uniref:hypothetical protein n=1 Tax=unclassified Azospirillum TaxID=2630922 RepID=UPI0036735B23
MADPKTYTAECSASSEYSTIPAVVVFSIDEAKAREIIRLAGLVKEHDLLRVKKFDYDAVWLNTEPAPSDEDAEDCDEEPSEIDDDDVSTECDCLNVSEDSFWFSCILKHTDTEVCGAHQSVRELAEHFGLEFGPRSQPSRVEDLWQNHTMVAGFVNRYCCGPTPAGIVLTASKALIIASEDRRTFYRVSEVNGGVCATKTFDLINLADPEAESDLVGTYSGDNAAILAFSAVCRLQGWTAVL